MASKKTRKVVPTAEAQDLGGIEGPGVGIVKIPALDSAIRKYLPAKERRMEASREEINTKQKVRDLMHANSDQIGKDADGVMRYKFSGKVIVLAPSDEKLRVENDDEENIE